MRSSLPTLFLRSLPSQVGYKSILHIHTACEECEVTRLICEIDPKTKEQKKARCGGGEREGEEGSC